METHLILTKPKTGRPQKTLKDTHVETHHEYLPDEENTQESTHGGSSWRPAWRRPRGCWARSIRRGQPGRDWCSSSGQDCCTNRSSRGSEKRKGTGSRDTRGYIMRTCWTRARHSTNHTWRFIMKTSSRYLSWELWILKKLKGMQSLTRLKQRLNQ